MRPIVIVGALLIAIGLAGLVVDNVTFTDKRTVIDAGPIKVTEDRRHTIPIPTIAGIVAVVAGVALVFVGRQARS